MLNHSQFTTSNVPVTNPHRVCKIMIWLYLVLLIFEGALRKWVFPGLANPLLIVRDPIAIWLLYYGFKHGLLRANFYLTGMLVICIAAIVTAIFWGHGNLIVALYGARILAIHFPLIFIIGRVFNRDDVLKIGTFLVWLSIPMTVLLIAQFFSPQAAFVNRGIGNDATGGGFQGALGYYRAPTTFSFTNGTTLFYSLVACFILYFWSTTRKHISRQLLIAATIGLCLAVPFSISRTLFFSILVSFGFMLFASFRKRKTMMRVVVITLTAATIFAGLNSLGIFQTATDVFSSRFVSANKTEGGVIGVLGDRYLGGMATAVLHSGDLPFWGYGLGAYTNVGSNLLSGKIIPAIGEQEWLRLIEELGILLGLGVICIRLGICIKIAIACYNKLISGDLLPWILLSFCLLSVPQGQWAQATALGFSVIIGGITIASMRQPDMKSKSDNRVAD